MIQVRVAQQSAVSVRITGTAVVSAPEYKVVINDAVVLDLTGDTVQAADLPKGVIAHSATGDKVTGTTNYAGSSNAGGSATSAEKLNNRLTIKLNGTSQGAWDGSSAKTIDITAASVGATNVTLRRW